MRAQPSFLILTAALIVSSAGLTACNDDNNSAAVTPSANTEQNFSIFVTQTFQQPANSTPVDVDDVALNFDVNEDPTAFNALLMM